ncbi:FidL-like protein [Sodalis sp. dw_96]|uniref:FidL-like protein n=1 Tax=Sodalis sp. dw_96 TaxID=2719794 RepID=UPI001BD4D9C1|nr:FidL-like protein [Sodalis sp. dw_96]
MKRILAAVCLGIIFFWLFYQHNYHNPFDGFHCSGLMVFRANTAQGRFSYTAEAKMFFTNDREGFYVLNGTFSHNGQTYTLHRTKFFTYRRKNNQDLYEIVITREIISNLDNTPQSVTDSVLMPVGESILPRFRRIDSRSIIVSLLYSPFFICAKE